MGQIRGIKMGEERYRQKRIEEEVRRTLESIDDLKDIEEGPQFYARVRQKIAAAESPQVDWLSRLFFGFRLAPALLAVTLVLNVMTAWVIVRTNNERRAQYRQDHI